MENCVFCKILRGEIHSYTIWEDEKHLAFLTIYPNTIGATVVITKEHHDSYAFDASDEILTDLIIASGQIIFIIESILFLNNGIILNNFSSYISSSLKSTNKLSNALSSSFNFKYIL